MIFTLVIATLQRAHSRSYGHHCMHGTYFSKAADYVLYGYSIDAFTVDAMFLQMYVHAL